MKINKYFLWRDILIGNHCFGELKGFMRDNK